MRAGRRLFKKSSGSTEGGAFSIAGRQLERIFFKIALR